MRLIDADKLLEEMSNKGVHIEFVEVEEILGSDVNLDGFTKLVQNAIKAYKSMVIDTIKNQPKVHDAKDAIEKQIPKKPRLGGDGYAPDGTFAYDQWICPNCNQVYEIEYDDYEYCPKCGQRIDWSDEE